MKVLFLEPARIDMDLTFNWYEKKEYGLGTKFIKEVIEFSSKLTRSDVEYRKYFEDIQCIKLRKFPFSIFFFKESLETISIIAVLHNRQDKLKTILGRR